MNNEQWFGYIVEKTENRTFQDYMETYKKNAPECIIQRVDINLLFQIKNDPFMDINLKVGDWLLSYGSCQSSDGVGIVTPPFKDFESACDYARENFGVNNFLEPPQKG